MALNEAANPFRFTGIRDCLPDFCDCADKGMSMNRHKTIKVRNDRGRIAFCPHTRKGWIQFHSSGVIIDGVFSGNMDGD